MADTKKKLTHSAEEIDEAIEKTKTNEADIAEAKAEIAEHTTNTDIHVTADEKSAWNATYSLSNWHTVWSAGADLNTVLTPGVYSAPTNAIAAECTSLPDGYTASGQAFKLIVEYTSTANFLRQTLIGRTGTVYSRTYNVSSASFGSWERYITSTEFAALEARVAALETSTSTEEV